MKPPRQKTVDARYRDHNNLNLHRRSAMNDASLINNLSEPPRSQSAKHHLNLPDNYPAPPVRSDSEGESDVPLIKRRRTTANQPAIERNTGIPPKQAAMSEHEVIDLTMDDDDESVIAGVGEMPQANRRLTPGVSERFGSVVSSTQVEALPRPRPIFAMAFLNIAQARLLSYAGPHTEELEKHYFQWQENGKPHDKICLICCSANTSLACGTCKRVYHRSCLKPAQTVGLAGGSFFCPLCTKRTWSEEAPSRDLDPERRLLALAAQLQTIGAMAAWMNMKDTGEALDDQRLLYEMDVTATDIAKDAPGRIDPNTASEAIMSEVSPEVKHEHIKEEPMEVQSSDKQADDDPLENEDQLQYIRCVCDDYQLSDDIERAMYGCDGCLAWQHADCMRLDTDYDDDLYFCERCRPEDHEKLLAAMSRGGKPWENLNRRTSASYKEASIDTEAGLSTRPPSVPSRQTSPLTREAENAPASKKPTHARHRKTRTSEAQPGQDRGMASRTKRNSLRSDSDGMLRGADAMTALLKADSAAKRDLYLYHKGWNRVPDRPELSPIQTMPMTEQFGSRGVSLTFAAEVPSNKDLPVKKLQSTKDPDQNTTRTAQEKRVSEEMPPSQKGRASPAIGTPGHTYNGAGIPESPPELAAEDDSVPTWQFYKPANPTASADQSGLDQSRPAPILSRPELATSISESFHRPRRALIGQEPYRSIGLRRPVLLHTPLAYTSFSPAHPPRTPRSSTYDLPGPLQDAKTQPSLASAVAASVLGSEVTLPVIQGLTQHPHALNHRFWQAVQATLHRIPGTKTDGILLRQSLDDRLPELLEGSFTTTQNLFEPATSLQHPNQQLLEPTDAATLAAAALEHGSFTERAVGATENTISRPSRAIPPSIASSVQATASRPSQPPSPPLSATTNRLISSTALGHRLAVQPAIATLLNEHSPLTEMTINVIKGLEREKILAYEYKFLIEQLADALPWEWPKEALKDASADAAG